MVSMQIESEAPAVPPRPTATIEKRVQLAAADRCDACSAAAKSEFHLINGHRLQFCGHHVRKHLAGLMATCPREFWIDPAELWMANPSSRT